MGKASRRSRARRDDRFVMAVLYGDGTSDVFSAPDRGTVDAAALASASSARTDGGIDCVATVERATGALRIWFDCGRWLREVGVSVPPFALAIREAFAQCAAPFPAPVTSWA